MTPKPRSTGPALLRAAALAFAALAGACGTTPMTHFYSLLPTPAPVPRPAADFRIELQEVAVPAQVDIPQMVVRTGPQELVPVETRRWIAPLGRELRAALSADLSSRLEAPDVHGLSTGDTPVYRIGVVVQRFDSALGAYARIDALWSLTLPGGAVLSCSSSATETIAPGYAALAAGHQRALSHIADNIAAAVSAARRNAPPGCPSG